MKLHLLRLSSGKDATIGALFDITNERKFLCWILEDEFRLKKVKGETRIPAGTYQIRLRKEGGFHAQYIKRFPKIHVGMLHVQDVPNFTFILIHCGNRDEETDGCLLVGDSAHFDAMGDSWVTNSAVAYQRIYPPIAAAAGANNCTLIVEDYA